MEGNKATAIATSASASFGYGAPCSHSIIFSNRATPVLQTALPCASFLRSQGHYHYSNSFVTTYNDGEEQLQALDFGNALQEAMPRKFSVCGLLDLLDNGTLSLTNNKMLHLSENEAVSEVNTKFFKVTVSVYLRQPKRDGARKNLVLSYAITYHHKIGQLYFALFRKVFQTRMLQLLKHLAQHTKPTQQLYAPSEDALLMTAV